MCLKIKVALGVNGQKRAEVGLLFFRAVGWISPLLLEAIII